MRRMITEKDVEKLDSIKPSEIEKLGKITEADIESVQSMQSPKDATSGQVLTADGSGRAVYKSPASGGIKRIDSVSKSRNYLKTSFTSKANFPGYKVASDSSYHQLTVLIKEFPHYSKPDGSTVYLSPNDYFIVLDSTHFFFGIKESVYDQFVADTATQETVLYSGVYGFIEYSY